MKKFIETKSSSMKRRESTLARAEIPTGKTNSSPTVVSPLSWVHEITVPGTHATPNQVCNSKNDSVEGRHLNPPGHPRYSFVTTFLRYFIGRAHQKNIRNDGIPPVPNRESTRQDARPEMPRICYGGIPRHLHPRREDSNRPRLRLR